MLKIGITGGIGSGKTTVCRIFETLGIPVYYADTAAKRLMVEKAELIHQIKLLFGAEAYLADGTLHRAHIAKIAFQDTQKLALLNAVVHPAVAADSLEWHQSQSEVPYTLKEAALLFESGSFRQLDKIICVTAPLATRINRVMSRDQVDEAAVLARIDKQMPEAEKAERSDFVIYNDGAQLLIPQILSIHRALTDSI